MLAYKYKCEIYQSTSIWINLRRGWQCWACVRSSEMTAEGNHLRAKTTYKHLIVCIFVCLRHRHVKSFISDSKPNLFQYSVFNIQDIKLNQAEMNPDDFFQHCQTTYIFTVLHPKIIKNSEVSVKLCFMDICSESLFEHNVCVYGEDFIAVHICILYTSIMNLCCCYKTSRWMCMVRVLSRSLCYGASCKTEWIQLIHITTTR